MAGNLLLSAQLAFLKRLMMMMSSTSDVICPTESNALDGDPQMYWWVEDAEA